MNHPQESHECSTLRRFVVESFTNAHNFLPTRENIRVTLRKLIKDSILTVCTARIDNDVQFKRMGLKGDACLLKGTILYLLFFLPYFSTFPTLYLSVYPYYTLVKCSGMVSNIFQLIRVEIEASIS